MREIRRPNRKCRLIVVLDGALWSKQVAIPRTRMIRSVLLDARVVNASGEE